MDLQLEVQKLRKKMWENKEVFLESEVKDLKKKLKKLMDYFISLTGLYKEQQHVIKKLNEETIQNNVGKALISFILTQSN